MARASTQRVNFSAIAERLGISVATVSHALRGLYGIHPETEVISEVCAKFPVVSLVHDHPGTEAGLIGIDDRRGIADLVHHLHAAGHRRIGFFGLCTEVSWSSARYAACIETLTRHDLMIDPRDVVRISLEQALALAEFARAPWAQVVEARRRAGADAWVCASSMTGRTLCCYLVGSGLKLPQDVALVSYHEGSYPRGKRSPHHHHDRCERRGAGRRRRAASHQPPRPPGESRRSILIPARRSVGETTRDPLPFTTPTSVPR